VPSHYKSSRQRNDATTTSALPQIQAHQQQLISCTAIFAIIIHVTAPAEPPQQQPPGQPGGRPSIPPTRSRRADFNKSPSTYADPPQFPSQPQ